MNLPGISRALVNCNPNCNHGTRALTGAPGAYSLHRRSFRAAALCGTECYIASRLPGMSEQPEITQRDLRNRSREIMDAVENGQAFTVTRDGHRIGELIPLRPRRRFVPRQEFAAMSRNASGIDIEMFRADQDAALDHGTTSPYDQ